MLVLGVHNDSIIQKFLARLNYARGLMNIQKDDRIKLAIVAASNHYAGFGQGTSNIFRNMLGLSDAKWEETEYNQNYHKEH